MTKKSKKLCTYTVFRKIKVSIDTRQTYVLSVSKLEIIKYS